MSCAPGWPLVSFAVNAATPSERHFELIAAMGAAAASVDQKQVHEGAVACHKKALASDLVEEVSTKDLDIGCQAFRGGPFGAGTSIQIYKRRQP